MKRLLSILPRSLKSQRGMTLIEIIIVVSILAALAAVLGGQVVSARKKSAVRQAKIQMAEIGKALEMYYTDCGSYPESFDSLLDGGNSGCNNWGPEPYVKNKNQLLDPWNTPFVYYAQGGSFTIISYGEDKKEGGTGYGKDLSSDD